MLFWGWLTQGIGLTASALGYFRLVPSGLQFGSLYSLGWWIGVTRLK
jgi:hypothetical protein